jgi:hypothetical protein
MPTFHVPIIAEVEAGSLVDARKLAYKAMDDLEIDKVKLLIANDENIIKDGRRIVLLHPEDACSDYDPEEYAASKLKIVCSQ